MTEKRLRKSTKLGKPVGASVKLKTHGPAILEKLRDGMPIRQACAIVGIDHSTYHHWIRMGEEKKHPVYIKFYEDAMYARAVAVERYMKYIEDAAKADPRNWPAAAWLLERTHPDEFAKRNPDVAVAIQNNNSQVTVNSSELKKKMEEYAPIWEDNAENKQG